MAVTYNKANQTAGLNSDTRLNAELTKIKAALQDAVSRSGTSPNAMEADLDMGGHDLLNVGSIDVDSLTVDGAAVPSLSDVVAAQQASEDARDAAQGYADAAEDSATAAALSAAEVDLPTLSGVSDNTHKIIQANGQNNGWELHQPTATATPGAVARRDSAGRLAVQSPVSGGDCVNLQYLFRALAEVGTISGLTLSPSSTDPTTDITVTAGVAGSALARVSSSVVPSYIYWMELASAITKDLASAGGWTAGDGGRGRPSTVAWSANTAYHVFIIAQWNGAADIGIDTDASAANLLTESGLNVARHIGYIVTDGSSQIRPFRQAGDDFYYDVPFQRATWSLSTTAANLEVGVPPNTVAKLLFDLVVQAASSIYTVVRHPDAADVAASATSFTFVLGDQGGSSSARSSFRVECPTNSSSEVAVRSLGTAGTALGVMTLGWTDTSRRI